MKNNLLIIREYILIAWIQMVIWLKAKWYIWTRWIKFRDAVNKAKDLQRIKGSQHHVIKSGNKLLVVDNKWMKNYNRIIKKRGGSKLNYFKLSQMALYSTR